MYIDAKQIYCALGSVLSTPHGCSSNAQQLYWAGRTNSTLDVETWDLEKWKKMCLKSQN